MTVAPPISGFSRTLLLFLSLEEELDVHATYGFFDHVQHLVLQVQSLVPPSSRFLPIVLCIDSECIEILASSKSRAVLKILSQID